MTLLSLPSCQLSLEECSHLTLDMGMVPVHNTFPIDSTHATLLQNYPLPSPCLDDLKHQFEQHQMKTRWYRFHPYTSLMSISSSRWTPSCLIKLNQQPWTTLWHQNWTPSMTLQSFNNPIFILLSTIQWRVMHKGNPTHVANSNVIRCRIHEEDGHYIVNCTKEQ